MNSRRRLPRCTDRIDLGGERSWLDPSSLSDRLPRDRATLLRIGPPPVNKRAGCTALAAGAMMVSNDDCAATSCALKASNELLAAPSWAVQGLHAQVAKASGLRDLP
jgi:hypothetical protein